MTIFYADLSHYSFDRHGGVPDFAALKASGIGAVCIRATYGDPVIYNPTTRAFREMAAAAKAVGLFVGGYHNLVHGDDASIARQVAYFKGELDAVGADWAMLDVEPYEALVTAGLWPRLDDAVRFEAAWTKADPQRVLAIYLAKWFWQRPSTQAGLDAVSISALQGPLVSSNYPPTTETTPVAKYATVAGDAGPGWQPYGGKTPEVWQFSSRATLPGVSSTEDINAYKGTLDQLKARLRKEAPVAWYLNRALTNFRTTVNARYPQRDKASDGTVGDPDHQSRDSDHNPDSDGSVDAWDMDVELNGPGKPYAADLQLVIDAALRHESIQYVIYNRRITSRSKPGGLGTWHDYDGPNPHDKHTHFNTRESHEDSTAPWHIEEDDMTPAEFLGYKILNPYTGDDATLKAFFQSINTSAANAYNEAKQGRLLSEAIVARLEGLNTKQVLERVNQLAADERALLEEMAQSEAARDAAALAEVKDALAQVQSGGATAEETLALIVAKLQPAA